MIGTGNEKGKGNGRFDCVKEVGVTRLKAERQVGSKKGAEKHLNIGMEGGQEGKSRWRKEGGGRWVLFCHRAQRQLTLTL
jgi:hypothetical protein